MIQMKPDKEAFERVCKQNTLTCKDVVDVFGWPAIELFLIVGTPSPEYCKQISDLLKQISSNLRDNRRSK